MLSVKFAAFFRERVVVDANVLIDLAEIDALQLLNSVFSHVSIPESIVQFELKTIDLTQIRYSASNICTKKGYKLFTELGKHYRGLSEFDRTLLSIAIENGFLCVTNEKPLRKVCNEYQIKYTGTLGILGCCYEVGIIAVEELAQFVDKLEASSCYLHSDLVKQFRDEFGLQKQAV